MRIGLVRNRFLIFALITIIFFIFISTPSSEAHVLIVADADNTTPEAYTEAHATADELKSKGYHVLELYKENATTKNIMKGMYNADAVIYDGHGGYETGRYDNNGGTASPPFALVGSNDFIWGIGDKMREGFMGPLIKPPYKSNIPVIIAHACFSTGWVENKEVANPIETIYNFSKMFTGSGANYYATGYYGNYQGKTVVDLIDELLRGATTLGAANQMNSVTITKSTTYNGRTIWRNDHGYAAFVGNWSGTFPTAGQTTIYNDTAAEAWYRAVHNLSIDTIPPKVISNSPVSGATGVSITSPIVIKFSENIIKGANFAGIYIKNMSTGKIVSLASKTISGAFLTIKQTYNRLYNDLYQVYIPAKAVKDSSNNNLALAYSYKFRTITGTTDTTPPVISSINPLNGAIGVSLTSSEVIKFSENILAGPNFAGIYIKNLSTGKIVSLASKIIIGNVLTIRQTYSRLRNNLYQVTIPAGAVKDKAGNKLATTYTFKFKTGG